MSALNLSEKLHFVGNIQLAPGGGNVACGLRLATTFFPDHYAASNSGVINYGSPVGNAVVVLAAYTSGEGDTVTPPVGITWTTYAAGRLRVFVGVATGSETGFTITSSGTISRSVAIVLPLIALSPAVQSSATDSGAGELPPLAASTDCRKSYGLAFIASSNSYSTPTQSGFTNPYNSAPLSIWESLDYATSSQSISVNVGSGTIYGVLLAFYTKKF